MFAIKKMRHSLQLRSLYLQVKKNHYMKKITLFFSAAIFFSTITMAQTKSSVNLKKGQKFVVENKAETTSSTEVGGQSMDTKINVTTTYNIDVKDKTDNYHLTNTITKMKMDMSMMGQEQKFDSDDSTDMNGSMGTPLKDYINHPKDVEMDQTGKVIPKESDSASGNLEQLAAQMHALETSGYGAAMAFQSLPKDIKVGDTWTDSSNENNISKKIIYLVKEIKGNIATITLSGSISTEATMENQGMEINTKIAGKISGQEKVDITTGIVQSNTSTIEQSGTVSAMGQDMPTSTKVISSTTVKEI